MKYIAEIFYQILAHTKGIKNSAPLPTGEEHGLASVSVDVS